MYVCVQRLLRICPPPRSTARACIAITSCCSRRATCWTTPRWRARPTGSPPARAFPTRSGRPPWATPSRPASTVSMRSGKSAATCTTRAVAACRPIRSCPPDRRRWRGRRWPRGCSTLRRACSLPERTMTTTTMTTAMKRTRTKKRRQRR